MTYRQHLKQTGFIRALEDRKTLRLDDAGRVWAGVHEAQYWANPAYYNERPFIAEPPPDYVF